MEPETTYHYAVLALSQDGNSVQSDAIGAATPAAPKKKDPPQQSVGPRQVTTTDVWTATLTPANVGTGTIGCDSGNSDAAKKCSTANILSDDDFRHDSTDYTVDGLYLGSGTLTLDLDNNITTTTSALTLVVGTTSFDIIDNGSSVRRWINSGLTWTVGTDVSFKLTETNNAPTVANAIPDQEATVGTEFSYTFLANTFNDADTGDTLNYSAKRADDSALPTWLAFDATTRTFSGTPTTAETVSVKVTASDGATTVSDEFDIKVSAAVSTDATLSALTVSPKDINGFASDRASYEVGVASTVTQATITPTTNDSAATVGYSTTDADGTTDGHQVSLSAGRNAVTVTVTAEDTITTQTYTLSINRGVTAAFGWKASDDFDGLITAGNDLPRGMWSDGTTMWVADPVDHTIYAYNMSSKAREASKDFNTLSAAGNEAPYSIWSNNITMWVADGGDGKLYAYDMVTKAHDTGKDITTAANPAGIWSDGG